MLLNHMWPFSIFLFFPCYLSYVTILEDKTYYLRVSLSFRQDTTPQITKVILYRVRGKFTPPLPTPEETLKMSFLLSLLGQC